MTENPETYESPSETAEGTGGDRGASQRHALTPERMARLRGLAQRLVDLNPIWFEGRRRRFDGPILEAYGEDEVLYIVEASPHTILALLDRLQAAEADLAELDAEFRAVDRNAAAEIAGLWTRIQAADALARAATYASGICKQCGVTRCYEHVNDGADEFVCKLGTALAAYQALRKDGGGADG